MEMSCPGRKGRDLDSTIVRCPKCGRAVEIFSDEQKARCRCGEKILREAVPSCIMWCPAAERCLGAVVDLKEVRKRIAAMQAQTDGCDYVKEIGRKIDQAHGRADETPGEEAEPRE